MFWMTLVRQWKAITFQMWVEWFLVSAALKLHFVLFCWILYVEHVGRIFTFADNWNCIHGKRSIRWRFGAILHLASVHSIGVQRHSIRIGLHLIILSKGNFAESIICIQWRRFSKLFDWRTPHTWNQWFMHIYHSRQRYYYYDCTTENRLCIKYYLHTRITKIGVSMEFNEYNFGFCQKARKIEICLGTYEFNKLGIFSCIDLNFFFEGNPVHGTRWAWETCKIWKKNSAFIK